MATENKEELVKKIAVLEAQLLELKKLEPIQKQLADVLKSKEEVIANEHNMRKQFEKNQVELESFKKLIETKDKQIEGLKVDLTKLANLFDEYITAYQDQIKMFGVFLKNSQTTEKYLAKKIEVFNGGEKKWL